MKTILISSFHQLISRNILSTPLLDKLLEDPEMQAVLLVPDDKQMFFQENFGRERVFVHGFPRAMDRRDMIMRYLALSAVHTDALEIIREVESGRFLSRFVRLFGSFSLGQAVIRLIDRIITPRGRFSGVLKKYSPALVFSTDIQNENDVRLIHEARAARVPVVGAIRSWDNLTTKGMIRVLPDTLVVPNLIVKQEAMVIDFVPERIIAPIGIPHYDRYFTPSPEPRDEFFRRMGLDSVKKTILFAPVGNRYIKNNLLDKTVAETLGGLDVNLLIRVPPSDYASLDGIKATKANVVFDVVGRGSPRGNIDRKLNEMGRADDDSLVAELSYCDVVVTGHSTITIDAAAFNKPVVLIAFDEVPRPFNESIRRYYKCDYYLPITKSGGVRFAETREALNPLVLRYLKDPRLEEVGRRRIVEEQAYRFDGKATERLVEALRSFLD